MSRERTRVQAPIPDSRPGILDTRSLYSLMGGHGSMDVEVTDDGSDSGGDSPDVVDTSTVVVVPDSGGSSEAASLVALAATVGAHEERIATLESAVQQVAAIAEVAAVEAEHATEVADSAVDTAVDAAIVAEEVAVEETPTESETVTDEPPSQTHWTQRSFAEWRSKHGRESR